MRKMTYTQAATCGENLKVRVTPEQYKKLKFAWINVGKKWFIEDVDIFGDCEVRFLYLGEVIEWGQSKDIFESVSYEEIELIDEPQHEPEYTIDELINMRGVYFWVDFEQSDEFLKKWAAAGNSTKIRGSWNCYFIITKGGGLCWESESLKENITERLVKIKPVAQKSELQHDFASQQEIWKWLAQGNKVVLKDFGDIYGFNCVGKLNNFSSPYKSTDISFSVVENWKKHTPPRLIRVNGVEVPAPLDSLDGLDFVWAACTSGCFGLGTTGSNQANFDLLNNLLSLRLLYATKEDAIKRAEAMLKFEVVE